MNELIQQLVNGLAAGSIYALIAIGYSLVYGVLGLINFAHGDVYMFATFVFIAAATGGLPVWLAVALALLTGAVLGILLERFTYRPLRNANRIAPTVTAVGAALVLENVAQLIWGAKTYPFPVRVTQSLIHLGGAVVSELQIIILVASAAMAFLLYVSVQYTSWGRGMRAIRDDGATAELIGIPVNRIVSSAYAVGSALGVIGGLLFAAYYNSVYVGMGFNGSINAFAAAVIGGIGSLRGAFLGGILLGVLQALAVGYIASGFENSIAFVALILILVFRPNGLFGHAPVTRA